ncbi:MAG TPA: methyltransferase [Puia sp.]|nr:methyltransferase [Puia sp.]
MPNPYFRFKQFTIQQDRCSMKVCTDSCILGAWTAVRLGASRSVLDIGAGTGLLSLMLAQESAANIEAIELDQAAAEQAQENIAASPWNDRIRLVSGDIRLQDFPERFDFIISNPPFFGSDLRSPQREKNVAKHDESLTLEELLRQIGRLLKPGGAFSVLLPFHRTAWFEGLAIENGFMLQDKLIVRQTPKHEPFRSVLLFRDQKPASVNPDEMVVRDESGQESRQLLSLLSPYYIR